MLRTRIIPCLQLIDESLVKTVRFRNHSYIGDPINTVRIFNELEVDELCFLDIRATIQQREPNLEILSNISKECFMPLAYGGGVRTVEMAQKILSIGFEKIVVNTIAAENPEIISELADQVGSQSVIGSIDVKKNWFGSYSVYIKDGTKKHSSDPVEYAQLLEEKGAGELILTSIDQEGTWSGFDLEMTRQVAESVNIPVIAQGGAGTVDHIADVVKKGGASAVGIGSMVVYQQQDMGVLVSFPDKKKLEQKLGNNFV